MGQVFGKTEVERIAGKELDSASLAAVNKISYEIAKKYNVLPLDVAEGKLKVAMAEPFNVFALDDIRFVAKMDVVPVAANAGDIAGKIEVAYGPAQMSGRPHVKIQSNAPVTPGRGGFNNESGGAVGASSASSIPGFASVASSAGIGTAAAAGDVEAAPAVRLANAILNQSVTMNASDIHLEPYEDAVRVRYRIDGSLIETMTVPKEQYSSLSTRIKIIAGMDIAEKRLPQDGRVEIGIDGGTYDFRVSTLPTVFGEKIVIRKLDRTGFAFDRKMLSFTERENRLIDSSIGAPRGIVLVTGPTGSGKTTTIYSLLSELNSVNKNIVTIEDPVEYIVRGISQVQVNTKAGLTFAGGLRSILRQDPDIIMVGEIRDEETAEIAVRAAITGHLVLSTLHTNDAPGSVARLMDMGMQPYLISEALSCVIAQRLVRTLCEHCKSGRPATLSELSILKVSPSRCGESSEPVIYDPVGCPKCNNIGFRGRRAIHELLHVGGDIKRQIERMDSTGDLRKAALLSGMTTLNDNCRDMVLQGITSIQEFMTIRTEE